MTFGFTPDANLAAEEGSGGLMVSSWYFAGLDGLGEAKLSAAVRRAADDE